MCCVQELSSEISSRQSQISTVENDLNEVLLIFSGDELPLVTELGHQVTQCHVCLSELMEKLELVKQLSEVEGVDGLGSLPSPLLDDVSLCACVCMCLCIRAYTGMGPLTHVFVSNLKLRLYHKLCLSRMILQCWI